MRLGAGSPYFAACTLHTGADVQFARLRVHCTIKLFWMHLTTLCLCITLFDFVRDIDFVSPRS
jgi:hypothetical protein